LSDKKTVVSINVLYLYCNDVQAIRHFYKDIIGLGEHDFGMPNSMYCGQTSDGVSMMWFKSEKSGLQKRPEWVDLPGFPGGKVEEPAWGIQLPINVFPEVVKTLKEEEVEALFQNPIWCQDSYWAFPVRDPMGYTVEVYSVPKEKPESKEWSND